MLAGNDAFFPEFESDDFLEEVVLSSAASSVTFSGLGTYATAGYKHLQVRIAIRETGAGTGLQSFYVRFNADTGTDYAFHRLEGNGSGVSSSSATSINRIQVQDVVARGASGSGIFGVMILDILDFSNASKNTTARILSGAAEGSNNSIILTSGLYNDTSAITSIELQTAVNSSEVGSRFSLYGSKG
jgi:hypothetical protein